MHVYTCVHEEILGTLCVNVTMSAIFLMRSLVMQPTLVLSGRLRSVYALHVLEKQCSYQGDQAAYVSSTLDKIRVGP